MAIQLLAMGNPPEAIRILDVRKPFLPELTSGEGAKLDFQQADVTSEESIRNAFSAPWPKAVSELPLTVFHTVALLRPFERAEDLYYRSYKVNVAGTANVLAAARDAGAGIFIYTSSSQAASKEVNFWFPPWESRPRNFVAMVDTEDFYKPLLPHGQFANNYSRSKAEAERLVCNANESNTGRLTRSQQTMRTGAIRPGNAIYGHKDDNVAGRLLQHGMIPTHSAPWSQSWIHVRNASLAHLLYENALLGKHADKVAGRPFLVTDGGPPATFREVYGVLGHANEVKKFRVVSVSPVIILLISYAMEIWDLFVLRVPLMNKIFPEPPDPINLYQLGLLAATTCALIDDAEARKAPEDGGIGYTPACSTLEGMTDFMVDWNAHFAQTGSNKL